MRTTVDIDDDVLEAARSLARRNRRSVGAVLSDLARGALRQNPPAGKESVGGFVPFERQGNFVTNELIDRLRDQDIY